ncbi:hypothetical protein ACFFX1_12875 [Dactylosporangium sucinum]|uniref:Flavin reductase n=1 Tax=Dactylosporangium sucinum TaxID=1424081 RepID=A0A917WX45_9ACTN|nr:hypothetical protein [Dactylosporangium sucinum]GGM41212.1 hypothetical protein GCM10007977_048280 [Dactylosporangium sucinum]
MSDVRHVANRPSWHCATCDEPWPCRERQIKFLEDYQGRRHFLRALLALWMYEAAEEMGVSAGDLHERFVGWSLTRR